MFGSQKMFCQYHTHKGPQEVSKDFCGHFQCISVPWTCEFVPQKKFSNQHMSGKKFSASCLSLQGCFASFMPTKVCRRSQSTLVGSFNVCLCIGYVNLSHRKSFPTNTCQEKVLCHMFGSPKMFCRFHAHKCLQKVSNDTCGLF